MNDKRSQFILIDNIMNDIVNNKKGHKYYEGHTALLNRQTAYLLYVHFFENSNNEIINSIH